MWNVTALRASNAAFLKELDAVVKRQVRTATVSAQRDAAKTNKFESRTGKTKASVKRDIALTARGYRGRIRSVRKVARYMEKGTRPHVIRAKRSRVLRFHSGGALVFRRSVNHPGTKPTWFMRDAAERAYARLGQSLSAEMARIGRAR